MKILKWCTGCCLTALLLSSCKMDKYTGYVYDVNEKPIKDVMVYSLANNQKVYTDSVGYFELNKVKNIADQLVFKKQEFSTDTISSVSIQNGEQQKKKFRGEIIHLLKKTYKDSIYKANGIVK